MKKLEFTLEYTHWVEYDPDGDGDYASLRLYLDGNLLCRWGDSYHDKGVYRAEGYMEGYSEALGVGYTVKEETRIISENDDD